MSEDAKGPNKTADRTRLDKEKVSKLCNYKLKIIILPQLNAFVKPL